mgnify:CR=1 FL=1
MFLQFFIGVIFSLIITFIIQYIDNKNKMVSLSSQSITTSQKILTSSNLAKTINSQDNKIIIICNRFWSKSSLDNCLYNILIDDVDTDRKLFDILSNNHKIHIIIDSFDKDYLYLDLDEYVIKLLTFFSKNITFHIPELEFTTTSLELLLAYHKYSEHNMKNPSEHIVELLKNITDIPNNILQIDDEYLTYRKLF